VRILTNLSDREAIEECQRKDLIAGRNLEVNALTPLWAEDAVALPPGEKPIISKKAVDVWLRGIQELESVDGRTFGLSSGGRQWERSSLLKGASLRPQMPNCFASSAANQTGLGRWLEVCAI
jgi:hypothetical protein